MNYVTLHSIDFKDSLKCTCCARENYPAGVPSRVVADGVEMGFKLEKVLWNKPFLFGFLCIYGNPNLNFYGVLCIPVCMTWL